MRGRRTAEAEQEDSETEYLDQPDYFGDDSSDDDEPAYLTEPASHKQPSEQVTKQRKEAEGQEQLDQSRLDKIAEILAEREAIKTTINLSFEKLCKPYNVPFELHSLYYNIRVGRDSTSKTFHVNATQQASISTDCISNLD